MLAVQVGGANVFVTSIRGYIAGTLEQWVDEVRNIGDSIDQERARRRAGQHGATEEELAFYQRRLHELEEHIQSFTSAVSNIGNTWMPEE